MARPQSPCLAHSRGLPCVSNSVPRVICLSLETLFCPWRLSELRARHNTTSDIWSLCCYLLGAPSISRGRGQSSSSPSPLLSLRKMLIEHPLMFTRHLLQCAWTLCSILYSHRVIHSPNFPERQKYNPCFLSSEKLDNLAKGTQLVNVEIQPQLSSA